MTPETVLSCYSDADWANDPFTRRSITGYAAIIGTFGPVSCQSKRQTTTALSSTEAEYMALSTATQEVLWLRSLLRELDLAAATGDERFRQLPPTIMHEDNQSCIKLASQPFNHGRSKHIDVRHHFICDHVEAKTISIQYCPTESMIADVLTKPLPQPAFEKLRTAMCLQ